MDHLAVFINGEDTRPEGFSSAAREDAEMVGVFEVLGEHDVTDVQQRGQLGDREVPDAPRVLKEV